MWYISTESKSFTWYNSTDSNYFTWYISTDSNYFTWYNSDSNYFSWYTFTNSKPPTDVSDSHSTVPAVAWCTFILLKYGLLLVKVWFPQYSFMFVNSDSLCWNLTKKYYKRKPTNNGGKKNSFLQPLCDIKSLKPGHRKRLDTKLGGYVKTSC